MKKLLPVIVLLIVVVIVLTLKLHSGRSPSASSPPPVTVVEEPRVEPRPIEIGEDAIRFDLTYRGLAGEDGQVRYSFAMGYGRGSDAEDNPFITSVRQRAQNAIHVVYNPSFKDRSLSAVETVDRTVTHFYFDCDADGKLSNQEILDPVGTSENPSMREYVFVTPDFMLASGQGDKMPFRAKLTAAFYGEQDYPQCMWSPACVLEGTGLLHGKKTRLILFTGGLDTNFRQYGRARYALMAADRDEQYPSRATLSSLIFHEGMFYQFRFEEGDQQGTVLRAVLVEDASPTGTLAVDLQGKEALSTRISYATVKGKADESIHFGIQKSQQFPVDDYVLDSGQFQFGRGEEHDWQVSFSKGPEFSIEEGQTFRLKLGAPTMAVHSVIENQRYNPDVKNLDTFASADGIYITPEVQGLGGELYAQFRKRDGQQFNDVKPHLTIKGPSGDEIVSQELEPG